MPSDDLSTTVRWPDQPEAVDLGPGSWDDVPEPAEILHGGAPARGVGSPTGPTPLSPGHSAPVGTVGAGRLLLEAYDRLADRVLDRLRALREDTDADLAAVRSEVAALRRAVEDVADRVQLRKLWSELDEVRTELAGLRSAVQEWPELQRLEEKVDLLLRRTGERPPEGDVMRGASVSAEVSALAERWQEDLPALRDTLAAQREALAAQAEAVEALRSEGVRLSEGQRAEDLQRIAEVVRSSAARPEVAAFAPMLKELAAMRVELEPLADLHAEMEALRRRVALRAQGPSALADDDLHRLADAVAERLLAQRRPPGRPS